MALGEPVSEPSLGAMGSRMLLHVGAAAWTACRKQNMGIDSYMRVEKGLNSFLFSSPSLSSVVNDTLI